MKAKVITRYAVLVLALINQFLANKGISPIPVDEETISSIILTVIALYTTYKDNPTTKEGRWANQKLKKYHHIKLLRGLLVVNNSQHEV